jgi:Uma2 family endonuclease
VTRPKFKHYRIQRRLRDLLLEQAPGALIDIEFAFRATAEHELRAADVAYVSAERAAAIDAEDNLHGSPELVIEILSKSNTAEELADKQALCLEHGAAEFWVVDPKRGKVTVWTPDQRAVTYDRTEQIPLPLFGDGRLAVSRIFDM